MPTTTNSKQNTGSTKEPHSTNPSPDLDLSTQSTPEPSPEPTDQSDSSHQSQTQPSTPTNSDSDSTASTSSNADSIYSPLPARPMPEPLPGSHIPNFNKLSQPKSKLNHKSAIPQPQRIIKTQQKNNKQAPPPPPDPSKKIPIQPSVFRYLIPVLAISLSMILIYFGFRQIQAFLKPPSDQPNPTTQPVELVYWGLWESPSAMERIIDDYQTLNPQVRITYQAQSPQDYRERLQNSLESGKGPDLFRFHNTWGPMLKTVLAVVPEKTLSKKQMETTFYPVIKNTLLSSDGYVGLPIQIDGLGLYYNRHLFNINGQVVPRTWEDLEQVAKELTIPDAQGGLQRAGIAMGTTNNVDHWSDILGLLLLRNGANPSRPALTQAIGSKTICLGCDALEYYTKFATQDRVWDENMPQSTYAFAFEKVAMMFAPSWQANQIHQINSQLDFAVAPVPQLPNQDIAWATYWVEGVSRNTSSAKQTAAWNFLSYLLEKETARQFYTYTTAAGNLFGEPFSRVDMAEQLIGDPFVGAFVSQAMAYQSWYLASDTADNGLNDQVIDIYQTAVSGVIQGESAQEMLQTAEPELQKVLLQYGVYR